MHHVVLVQVVDGIEHLADRLGSVLFRELSLFANAVKELSTRRQLRHNVVLVLDNVSLTTLFLRASRLRTRDSNQSWNLTMCGCFMRCSISSSS